MILETRLKWEFSRKRESIVSNLHPSFVCLQPVRLFDDLHDLIDI